MAKYNYSVGRRKEATAVVKLFPHGTGKYTILMGDKKISLKDYFGGMKYLYTNAITPFEVLGKDILNQYDGEIVLRSGGIAGHSNAMRLGFAQALIKSNPDWRVTLKPYGLLERDSRVKERKKPGLKKARKAPTRSKR